MENLVQLADGSFGLRNAADDVNDLHIGGPASPSVAQPRFYAKRIMKVPLAALDTGGGVLSWQNTASYAVLIDRIIFDVTTKSTGACTVDVGNTPTSATTSSDTLMDGLDVGTATGTFDNITEKGTNGKSRQKVAAGKWITGSMASGAAAGLVGFAYIEFFPV